jgi:hypothetical protein
MVGSLKLSLFISTLIIVCSCGGNESPASDSTKILPQGVGVGQPVDGAPIVTLGTGRSLNKDWKFVWFTDKTGSDCIAVDYGKVKGIPACGIEVSDEQAINAAFQRPADDIVISYGRTIGSNMQMKTLKGVESVPVYTVPKTDLHYFAVLSTHKNVLDIYTRPPQKPYSLKSRIDDFNSNSNE